jgi:hypothetical protein
VSFTILFFLAPIGVIVAWWLSRQRLMAKPWLDVSAIGEIAARRGRIQDVGDGLIVGVLFALTFLVGQLYVWRQLNAAGYFLFTGVYGLHLLGGLVALGKTGDKVWRGFEVKPGALERAAVRSLLAFSACPLARLIQSPDAVGGRFRTSSVVGW